MSAVHAALFGMTIVAVGISAVTDIRARKIKNWVTFPAIALGLLVHTVAGGWDGGEGLGLKWSLIGLAIGCLPFLVMNTLDSRAFGLGDVKLMAAVGALLAWPLMLEVLLFVALAGGVVAFVTLIAKRTLIRTLSRMLARRRDDDGEKSQDRASSSQYIPYGVAIAGGTLMVVALEVARRGIF
ncbi:MAG: A24 family peptidase [Myxococcota bacterium]